ncbi:MAG: haloacid dehalogenase type II [Azospirillum sp.]|nr:haloacid dehalogenase type II [Azospirillum sp.]
MTEIFDNIAACVFDAYGTLLDVNSAAQQCRADLGDQADALSQTWRVRQLEYSWLRSLMGRYADFWQITGEALDYAMAVHGIDNPVLRARLMALYLNLTAYPDAPETLARLKRHGMKTAILSNGSPTMLTAAVDSARLRDSLDAVYSVDSLGIFKPHPSVYQMASDRLEVVPARILFVSSNGWDVAGAAAFGFRVAWINRSGLPTERLPAKADVEIARLDQLPDLLGW